MTLKKRLISPLFALVAWASALLLHAFPPALCKTLFGTVRAQVGQTLEVEGAAQGLFSLVVEMTGARFHPIESSL